MEHRHRRRRPLRGLICCCAVGLALLAAGGRALAEPTRASAAHAPDPFPAEPPLDVTGRVAKPALRDDARISQPAREPVARETAVPGGSEVDVPPAAPDPRVIEAGVLAVEIKERSSTLRDCRVDVARRHRRAWSQVAARRVTLRWTILRSGEVAGAEVVAVDPADGALLDCIKQRMSQWAFTPPVGGALPVERTFSFRNQRGVARKEPLMLPVAQPSRGRH